MSRCPAMTWAVLREKPVRDRVGEEDPEEVGAVQRSAVERGDQTGSTRGIWRVSAREAAVAPIFRWQQHRRRQPDALVIIVDGDHGDRLAAVAGPRRRWR